MATIDELFAEQAQPSGLESLLTHPVMKYGLPLAAGIAGSFGRHGKGAGYSIAQGIQGGLQTMQGLSQIDTSVNQRQQRAKQASQWALNLDPKLDPAVRANIHAGLQQYVLTGKEPEALKELSQVHNVPQGGGLVTGAGKEIYSRPAAEKFKTQLVQDNEGKYWNVSIDSATGKVAKVEPVQAPNLAQGSAPEEIEGLNAQVAQLQGKEPTEKTPPQVPSNIFAAQAVLRSVQQAKAAGRPVPPRVAQAFDTTDHDSIISALTEAIAKETQRQQQNITVRVDAETQGSLRKTFEERTNIPVSAKEVQNFVDINGRNPLETTQDPNQLTPNALAKAGFRYMPADRRRAFDASLIGLTQVARIRALGEQIFKGISPGENIGNYIRQQGRNFIARADVRAFLAIINETLPVNAIASGLTPGRVGSNIIEKVERPILPALDDSLESFRSKLGVVQQRLTHNAQIHFGLGAPPALIPDIRGAYEEQAQHGLSGAQQQQQQPQKLEPGQVMVRNKQTGKSGPVHETDLHKLDTTKYEILGQ